MDWIQADWQLLAGGAAAMLVGSMVWRSFANWDHGHKGRKKLAKRYALEAKPYKEVEKAWLDSLAKLRTGNTLLIPIIHDISFDFLPRDFQRQYLTVEEASTILAEIDATNSSIAIDVVLHTLGGDALAAEMVADAIKSHKGRTRAYVPYVAMSAGTLIALAADELYMGRSATLGPIDTQYYGMPADAWEHLIKGGDDAEPVKRPIRDDAMFMLAYVASKRGKSEQERTAALLNRKYQRKTRTHDSADAIVKKLRSPSHHGERFSVDKVRKMGIEASTDMRPEIAELVDLRLRLLEMYPKHGMEAAMQAGGAGGASTPASGASAAPRYAPVVDLRSHLLLPGRGRSEDARRSRRDRP